MRRHIKIFLDIVWEIELVKSTVRCAEGDATDPTVEVINRRCGGNVAGRLGLYLDLGLLLLGLWLGRSYSNRGRGGISFGSSQAGRLGHCRNAARTWRQSFRATGSSSTGWRAATRRPASRREGLLGRKLLVLPGSFITRDLHLLACLKRSTK